MTRRRIARHLVPGTLLALTLLLPARAGLAASDGQITWAVPISITPAMLDPVDHQGGVTSLLTFYALHDALVKPMPGWRWRRVWPNRGA